MTKKKCIEINIKGSLGILALGDLGLVEWRKVRDKANQKNKNEKK